MQQLSLAFEPGLSQRSRSLREHTAARIYAQGIVAIAGKIDVSPSKLTEKLAGASSDGKPRCLTVDEFEQYIEKTGDLTPIYYLVDKFCRDPAVQQQEALAKLAVLADALPGLLAQAGIALVDSRKGGRR